MPHSRTPLPAPSTSTPSNAGVITADGDAAAATAYADTQGAADDSRVDGAAAAPAKRGFVPKGDGKRTQVTCYITAACRHFQRRPRH
jgi:hypothetical protein